MMCCVVHSTTLYIYIYACSVFLDQFERLMIEFPFRQFRSTHNSYMSYPVTNRLIERLFQCKWTRFFVVERQKAILSYFNNTHPKLWYADKCEGLLALPRALILDPLIFRLLLPICFIFYSSHDSLRLCLEPQRCLETVIFFQVWHFSRL